MKTLKLSYHHRICYLDSKECRKYRDGQNFLYGVMIQYRKHWWNRWRYVADSFFGWTTIYESSPYNTSYYFVMENHILNTVYDEELNILKNIYNERPKIFRAFMDGCIHPKKSFSTINSIISFK